MRQVGGVDSGAVVRYGNRHLSVRLHACRYHDSSTGLGMLQRVVYHVAERLAHAHPVEVEFRQRGSLLERQSDCAHPGLRLPPLQFGAEQLGNRTRRPHELQFAGVGFRQPVQVAHQVAQQGYFADDPVRPLGRLLQTVEQPLRFQLDDAQRRVQLVRQIIDQPAAQIALRVQGGGHAVERGTHLSQFVA